MPRKPCSRVGLNPESIASIISMRKSHPIDPGRPICCNPLDWGVRASTHLAAARSHGSRRAPKQNCFQVEEDSMAIAMRRRSVRRARLLPRHGLAVVMTTTNGGDHE